MNSDSNQEIQVIQADSMPSEHSEEGHSEEVEYESVGDYHRQAAHYFSAAAKYHLKAADADGDGDEGELILNAHLAYRHQLNGIQYAEIAAMECELESDEAELDQEVTG
jgi:hypothetical protein